MEEDIEINVISCGGVIGIWDEGTGIGFRISTPGLVLAEIDLDGGNAETEA